MSNLLGKLNVLVRSSINGVLRDETGRDSSRQKLPKGEVEALRQQINRAIDDEDRQLADMETLRQQIASWDQQADKALSAGDEATARHAIRQMQTQQRQLTMLEADLAQHRIATADLINRVNELEAVVAEARVQQAESSTGEKGSSGGGPTSRLRQARQHIEQKMTQPVRSDAPPGSIDEDVVEDDLARRRARLSQQD